MHTLFGITLVLYLLKLSAGKGFWKNTQDSFIKFIIVACTTCVLLRITHDTNNKPLLTSWITLADLKYIYNDKL